MIDKKPLDFIMDLTRWQLAEKFGWTLDYVNSLSLGDLQDYDEYNITMDGLEKGYSFLARIK